MKNKGTLFVTILAALLWGAQLAVTCIGAVQLIKLNMLPLRYFVLIMVVLMVLLILTFVLLFIKIGGRKKRGKKKQPVITVKRVIGMLLSIVVLVAGVYASDVVGRANRTIETVTTPQTATTIMGVYVAQNDPAQTIEDTVGYTFAITGSVGGSTNTAPTVQWVQYEQQSMIETRSYPTALMMADALFNGEVNAIILDTAYADSIDAAEGYENFSEETRLLTTYNMEDEVPEFEGATDLELDIDLDTIEVPTYETKVVDDITGQPFIVYLSGSDTRSTILTTSRSDVNIIAAVNPATREVLLVNTPRDYYVQISIGGGSYDKLTHCGIYGIDCSMDTLANLYDVDINYYAQINFTGFETLIDAIGGITVDSDEGFTTNDGYSIAYGTNTMDGAKALSFARERYHVSGGDNGRGRHQMMVISAVIDKMTSSSTLISNYASILESLEGMFTTNMDSKDISALVQMQLDQGGSWNVHSFAVTGTGSSSSQTYSMRGSSVYVMLQNEGMVNYASELIERVMDGETLTDRDVVYE